ncbi:MAG: M1 family metallopeptidase, partial [Planctomycetota bacterium]
WRNDRSSWMLEDRIRGRSDRGDKIAREDWGWIRVESMRLVRPDGEVIDLATRFESPDDGNPDDRTVLVAGLPAPVGPGETVVVESDWTARVPRTFARTGVRGDFYFIAHWFPKLGVFEPGGWNCHQYHAATEYYSDYGSYDVALTVPSGWVLGATGREAERRDNGDGTTTHRYLQQDVHAFTWTTSPDYLVAEETFAAAGLPPVEMRLLYQPEHGHQVERHLAAVRHTLELYGSWYGPYPYGHVTVVDPAWGGGAGGMEYPTLFTCGTRLFNPLGGGSPEGVTIHEAGHQFWYGIVGNNEFEHAWIDEGLNTFSTLRVQLERYGRSFYVKRYFRPPGTESRGFLPVAFRQLKIDPWLNRLERYRPDATSDAEAMPTWQYFPASAGNITYSKTALWLVTLERWLGWPTLRGILSTFFERWKFRHPGPDDFLAVANEVAGRDLGPFFDQVYRGSEAFDYEVSAVSSLPVGVEGWVEESGEMVYREGVDERALGDRAAGTVYRTEVVVRRNGGAVFPVDVLLAFEDGSEVRHHWDGRYRWRLFVEERPARLAWAEVDPDRVLALDLYPSNNSQRLEPRAALPAVKWASKWMIWFQDRLLGFGFFA